MATLINLVATRSKDGDHAALFRWYNDHVHLLMGFAPLQETRLFRRLDAMATDAPEYACLYRFASHADFLAFEESEARARAAQVVQSGWGRNGIEITQRTQFLRLGRRSNADDAASGEPLRHHFQCLQLGAAPVAEMERWLSDHVHCSLAATGHRAAEWHREAGANAAGGLALVTSVVPAGAAAGNALAELTQARPTPPGEVGQSPATVACRWQGLYQRLARWRR